MEKLNAGIIDAHQTRELMKDPIIHEVLSEAELSIWKSLR